MPATCQLTADCPTMFEGLAPVSNDVYFPANTQLTQLSNSNGTLTYQSKPLSTPAAQASSEYTCNPPGGSYSRTCPERVSTPYHSTDPHMANTQLCQTKASCRSLRGTEIPDVVYYNIKQSELADTTTVQKIENCNGRLVAGPRDDRCQGETSHVIEEIARIEGEKTLVLG